MKAGFARVRIPVRPDFERGIFHFLDTGRVWDGGELPEVTNPDYIAFLDEIQERRPDSSLPDEAEQLRPAEKIPVGDPWDLRLPTTLVRVKPTPTLPAWQQVDGEWLPVEEE